MHCIILRRSTVRSYLQGHAQCGSLKALQDWANDSVVPAAALHLHGSRYEQARLYGLLLLLLV